MKKLATLSVAAVVGLSVLTGCAGKESNMQEIRPTYAGPQGQCMEADDELCDEDPYDLDDLFGDVHEPRKPSAKPSTKPSTKPVTVPTRKKK